jgi:hypothetical protein
MNETIITTGNVKTQYATRAAVYNTVEALRTTLSDTIATLALDREVVKITGAQSIV